MRPCHPSIWRARLTAEQMQSIEDRLVYRLGEQREMKSQIADDIETFHLQVREMDQLVMSASQNLIRTRATIWIWSRAHARLAGGVTDPAKIDMVGIAKQALEAAMPF